MTQIDQSGGNGEQEPKSASVADVDRRDFLSSASSVAMAGGLVAGYGTFVVMAGRYLYPSAKTTTWMYVSPVAEIPPGQSLAFTSPTGLKVMIRRGTESSAGEAPTAEDFLALSSICPHLGCRVHWEPHNDRYFCPCHNGAFDADGRPVEGPPKADNQHLPKYPLMVQNGLLYIEMPAETVGTAGVQLTQSSRDSGPRQGGTRREEA